MRGCLGLRRTAADSVVSCVTLKTGFHVAVVFLASCYLLCKVIARIIVGIEIETSVDIFVR